MRFIEKVRLSYKIEAESATDPYTKKVVDGYIEALLWSSSGSDQQGTEHESLENFEPSKELQDYALKTVKEFLAKAEKEGKKMLDLEEMKRLCGGRTPGPWFISYIATALRIMRKSGPDASDLEGYDDVKNCPRDEDAFFITYMGTHADTILAELTAARRVVDAAELFLDEFLSKKTCAPGALQRALNEYRSAKPQSPGAGHEG